MFFASLALLDWFIARRKVSRKKDRRIVLLILILTAAWNLTANLVAWWPDPFRIIRFALGWA
ncbi:hypothetical protein XI25_11725 [Paenibacillus sp. DMB20]|nr:hypothetical protein XI25_11725 [Paenibacillus sp. DMB20]